MGLGGHSISVPVSVCSLGLRGFEFKDAGDDEVLKVCNGLSHRRALFFVEGGALVISKLHSIRLKKQQVKWQLRKLLSITLEEGRKPIKIVSERVGLAVSGDQGFA